MVELHFDWSRFTDSVFRSVPRSGYDQVAENPKTRARETIVLDEQLTAIFVARIGIENSSPLPSNILFLHAPGNAKGDHRRILEWTWAGFANLIGIVIWSQEPCDLTGKNRYPVDPNGLGWRLPIIIDYLPFDQWRQDRSLSQANSLDFEDLHVHSQSSCESRTIRTDDLQSE